MSWIFSFLQIDLFIKKMKEYTTRFALSSIMSRIKFVFLILTEPFVYYPTRFASLLGLVDKSRIYRGSRIREKVVSPVVRVCTHEWGGYELKRKKNVEGRYFNCGLFSQLERFKKYREKGVVNLTITMSDVEKHPDIGVVKSNCDNFIEVSNVGMDFNGYSTFYKRNKSEDNCYVILTNSSVEESQCDFLDGYIKYMEDNPDVGILGISYSTRMYHTLIRRNFVPHIQSFFLMTTLAVLKDIVTANKGRFPGENAIYKRLLIRKGEIPLSKIALKLGYSLAVVYPEDGIPFKFTDKKHWKHPFDDLRLSCTTPNKLVPITESKKKAKGKYDNNIYSNIQN